MSDVKIKTLTPAPESWWGTKKFFLLSKLNYVSVLLMIAGFVLGVWAIKLVTPGFWPKSFQPIPDTMRIFLAQEPGEVDVVMMGTSHVYRGFEPKYFEEETGVSAFALSYPGMTGHEMEKMVDFLIQHADEKGVEHVILEAREFRDNLTQNIYTDRAIFEHDIQTLKDVWSHAQEAWPRDSEQHQAKRREYVYEHLQSTIVNFIGMSRLMRYDFSREMGDPTIRKARLQQVRDELDAGERIVGAYVPKPKRRKEGDPPESNKIWAEHVPAALGNRYEGDSFWGRFKSVMAVVVFGNPSEAERELQSKIRESHDEFTVIRDKGFAILNGRLAEKNYPQKLERFTENMTAERMGSSLTPTEIRAYNRMFAKLRDAGIEPHLIIWPTIAKNWRTRYDSFLNARDEGLLDVNIIDLRDPPYVDPFYDMSIWADDGHLNAKGAPFAARETGRAMIDAGVLDAATEQ